MAMFFNTTVLHFGRRPFAPDPQYAVAERWSRTNAQVDFPCEDEGAWTVAAADPTPVLRVPGPPHKTLCTRRRAPRVRHGSTSRSRRPHAGLTFRSAAPVRLRPVLGFVVARSLALRRSGTTETGAPIDRSAFGSTLQGARRTANDMTPHYRETSIRAPSPSGSGEQCHTGKRRLCARASTPYCAERQNGRRR